jgi:ornithine carbamoyltransferase
MRRPTRQRRVSRKLDPSAFQFTSFKSFRTGSALREPCGEAADPAERIREITGYQINEESIRGAKPDALVMHCLPAYRGKEITEAAFEANAETIFDEAENRLHVQKAIMSLIAKR